MRFRNVDAPVVSIVGLGTHSSGPKVGCQTQNGYTGPMRGATTHLEASRLTAKGAATRQRIVEAAAELMHDATVADTTLLDIQKRANVSGSQLYHYFADKDEIVHAVIDYRVSNFVARQQSIDLSTFDGICDWRDWLVAFVGSRDGRGGCPLGSFCGQLAETDLVGRLELASAFDLWEDAFHSGLKTMQSEGRLRADVDTSHLATALLAATQGGLLLAQLRRDVDPLKVAIDAIVELIRSNMPHATPD
jgi:TetR/AcrR family transcriptional repressor of nem operon